MRNIATYFPGPHIATYHCNLRIASYCFSDMRAGNAGTWERQHIAAIIVTPDLRVGWRITMDRCYYHYLHDYRTIASHNRNRLSINSDLAIHTKYNKIITKYYDILIRPLQMVLFSGPVDFQIGMRAGGNFHYATK